jgi:endonuclease/exonuclease/phosphatase family metal-dependent hydrolase
MGSSEGGVDWNIDRGTRLQGILEFIRQAKADVILLQEVDLNAKRAQRLDIAREIARTLQLNFVTFHTQTCRACGFPNRRLRWDIPFGNIWRDPRDSRLVSL